MTKCVLLWNQISTGAPGNVRVCCNSSKPDIYKADHHQLMIQSVDGKLMDHEAYKALRQMQLDGQWPSQCARCKDVEDVGGNSYRMMHNSWFPEVYDKLEEYGTEPGPLQYLSLDIGTKCNMACRMCGPFSSSLWQRQLGQPVREDYSEIIASIKKQISLSDVTQIKRVYVIGGEPFVTPEFWELLDYLIELGIADKIELHLNTNMSVWKPEWNEIFQHFRFVGIGVSIDGVGRTCEYIRWPIKWTTIDSNLQELISTKHQNTFVTLHITLQNLNLANLPAFFKRYEHFSIHVNELHYPDYLHFSNVPINTFEKVLNSDLPEHVKEIISRRKPMENDTMKNMFLMKMEELDKKRKESLFEIEGFEEWKTN